MTFLNGELDLVNNEFRYYLRIIYSYFLGSIPFGLIITKIFLGKDIRNIGSEILEQLMF